MSFSIIIPAFNEEDRSIEVIVVDNNSDDQTATLARASGATLLSESDHNISKVRNTGAKAANGDILVFIDADTLIPENLLWRISQFISLSDCIYSCGGFWENSRGWLRERHNSAGVVFTSRWAGMMKGSIWVKTWISTGD